MSGLFKSTNQGLARGPVDYALSGLKYVLLASILAGGSLVAKSCRDADVAKENAASRVCFNAKFSEYIECRRWAWDMLKSGHAEKELKAEVDGDEEEETATEWLLNPRETDA